MKWQIVSGAPVAEFLRGRSVYMNLPCHGRERREVVLAVDRNPRQAITAMNLARCSYAERSTTIVQGDLRDGSEEVLARRFKPGDRGDQ